MHYSCTGTAKDVTALNNGECILEFEEGIHMMDIKRGLLAAENPK